MFDNCFPARDEARTDVFRTSLITATQRALRLTSLRLDHITPAAASKAVSDWMARVDDTLAPQLAAMADDQWGDGMADDVVRLAFEGAGIDVPAETNDGVIGDLIRKTIRSTSRALTGYEPGHVDAAIRWCIEQTGDDFIRLANAEEDSRWRELADAIIDRSLAEYPGSQSECAAGGGVDAVASDAEGRGVRVVPDIDSDKGTAEQLDPITGTGWTPADADDHPVPVPLASACGEMGAGGAARLQSAQGLRKGSALPGSEEDGIAPVPDRSRTGTAGTRPAMPDSSSLLGAVIQFWHVPEAQKAPGWRIKIESFDTADAISDGLPRVFYAGFGSAAKKVRFRVAGLVEQGRLSEEFADRFDEWSRHLGPHQMIALITKNMHDKRASVQAGRSSNEKNYCEQFAVLTLNAAGDAPLAVDLYLDEGDPVQITKITTTPSRRKDGAIRKDTASGWIAYYDPDGLSLNFRRERNAIVAARQQAHGDAKFSPRTWVGETIQAVVQPVAVELGALKADNKALKERVAELERRFGILAAHATVLRSDTAAGAEGEPAPSARPQGA